MFYQPGVIFGHNCGIHRQLHLGNYQAKATNAPFGFTWNSHMCRNSSWRIECWISTLIFSRRYLCAGRFLLHHDLFLERSLPKAWMSFFPLVGWLIEGLVCPFNNRQLMIDGIPNRPLYFSQKDIIGPKVRSSQRATSPMLEWILAERVRPCSSGWMPSKIWRFP